MRSLLAVLTFIGAVVLVLALRACYIALEQKALEIKAAEMDNEEALRICKKKTNGRILTQSHCKYFHDCMSYGSGVETCIEAATKVQE